MTLCVALALALALAPGWRPGVSVADPFDGLSPAACGFVWTVARGAGEGPADAAEVSRRLVGRDADPCRAALLALAAMPAPAREQALARLLTGATASVPAGIERVHPGWLRAALEGEPTEILRAISAGLPAPVVAVAEEIAAARGDGAQPDDGARAGVPAPLAADVVAELRRVIFASLVDMPDAATCGAAETTAWQRLTALPTEAVLVQLARTGAEVLGVSLAGAPPSVIARAAARAGQVVAAVVLETARRSPAAAERDRARALVAAASQLTSSPSPWAALGAAHAVGLVALADRLALEPSASVRAVAQRLPPLLGRALLAEHAHAAAGRRGIAGGPPAN